MNRCYVNRLNENHLCKHETDPRIQELEIVSSGMSGLTVPNIFPERASFQHQLFVLTVGVPVNAIKFSFS